MLPLTHTRWTLSAGNVCQHADRRRGMSTRARAISTKPEPHTEDRGIPYLLASHIVHNLEKAVVNASGVQPGQSQYLQGNFAPVEDERFDQQLEVVEGQLPAALNGAFLRTGPNPALPPTGGYHWFDGDGMVHCVRIKDGQASYCNRYVDTARLRQERAIGFPQFIKFGDSIGVPGVAHALLRKLKEKLGINDNKRGTGTGNTALVYHAEKLLALHEGDLPYALRVACEGVVETLGRQTYNGELGHCFTAHPKVDPATGELFFFGYSVEKEPYCWYSQLDKEGNLVRDFAVPLPQPIMMHDMALTEEYVIFFDSSLVFKPEMMVKEGASPFVFDKARPSRFGVLPRYASDASQIRWFETDALVAFHTANAWQEGDKIKLNLCTFENFDLDMKEFVADSLPYLTEVTMDMGPSGSVSMRRVSDVAGDFPQVPASLVGRKSRYAYMAAMAADVTVPTFYGIAKVDLEAGDKSKALAGLVEYGAQRLGGEAFFVPGEGKGEDDGYLITFVHDEASGQTELQVFDAKTMSSKPVARVRMPRRVPFGFHCYWISEQQLQAQAKAAAIA